ncbi:hypothetical protein ncot_01305 [Nocardioides sp. JQ2195]|uniref:hypothetical protein n=1 Tax=Nocardioides sp. JQ2195 TaxID=2592334 RepID=UPI00143E4515|nr:hypothetical protein [Nocardioides sp. JQ2195]QIX25374.1 hypothetical protein ncot_01305 [Nocardioides sp. JQ2195]
MSGFEIDLDEIEGLPRPMRHHQAAILASTTLPSPDTGASTASTRDAIDRVSTLAGSFAADLDQGADGLDAVVATYQATDGRMNYWFETIQSAVVFG